MPGQRAASFRLGELDSVGWTAWGLGISGLRKVTETRRALNPTPSSGIDVVECMEVAGVTSFISAADLKELGSRFRGLWVRLAACTVFTSC